MNGITWNLRLTIGLAPVSKHWKKLMVDFAGSRLVAPVLCLEKSPCTRHESLEMVKGGGTLMTLSFLDGEKCDCFRRRESWEVVNTFEDLDMVHYQPGITQI